MCSPQPSPVSVNFPHLLLHPPLTLPKKDKTPVLLMPWILLSPPNCAMKKTIIYYLTCSAFSHGLGESTAFNQQTSISYPFKFFHLHVFPFLLTLCIASMSTHTHTHTYLPCGFGLNGVLVKVRHHSRCHHRLAPKGSVVHDTESQGRHKQLLLWQVLWHGGY